MHKLILLENMAVNEVQVISLWQSRFFLRVEKVRHKKEFVINITLHVGSFYSKVCVDDNYEIQVVPDLLYPLYIIEATRRIVKKLYKQ